MPPQHYPVHNSALTNGKLMLGGPFEMQDSLQNENLRLLTSPQRHTQIPDSHQNPYFDFDQDNRHFMTTEQVHGQIEEVDRMGNRKLQSTQGVRNKRKAVTMADDVNVAPQPDFGKRLDQTGGQFAIVDPRNSQIQRQADSIVKICITDPKPNDISGPKSVRGRKRSKTAVGNSRKGHENEQNPEVKDENQICNQISEVANGNDTARELSPM